MLKLVVSPLLQMETVYQSPFQAIVVLTKTIDKGPDKEEAL